MPEQCGYGRVILSVRSHCCKRAVISKTFNRTRSALLVTAAACVSRRTIHCHLGSACALILSPFRPDGAGAVTDCKPQRRPCQPVLRLPYVGLENPDSRHNRGAVSPDLLRSQAARRTALGRSEGIFLTAGPARVD